MQSPLLWAAVPFGDTVAWADFLGEHERWHRSLARATRTRIFTLDDLTDSMDVHAELHTELAHALGAVAVPGLDLYDLSNEDAFVGFMQIHSAESLRLQLVAGVL